MSTKEFRVSYSMDVEAESAQEAAEILADYLTDASVPLRGMYEVEGEDGDVTNIDMGEGAW